MKSVLKVIRRYWKRWVVDFLILLMIVSLYNLIDYAISDEMVTIDGLILGVLFSIGFFVVFKVDNLIWKDSVFEDFINYLRSKNGK